jgi:phenylacetate-CoA ligase
MSHLRRLAKRAYYSLPSSVWLPRAYSETRAVVAERQRWPRERVNDFEVGQLKAILQHAGKNVPYYRSLFRQIGFDPDQFRSLEDLQALPLLEKQTVSNEPQKFVAENISKANLLYCTTGGTSGRPLGLYQTKDIGWQERAYIDDQWSRVGFTFGTPRAMLKGAVVFDKRQLWEYDPSARAFVFSNFHLNTENAARYAAKMVKENLTYFHSYPSAAMEFALRLKESGISPPRFKALFLGSENLYPGQKEALTELYQSRLFTWYGHSENLALAGYCETSDHYHVYSDYGFVELITASGSQANSGEEGEIIGTSLRNYAMPLIRYKTDDWAVAGPATCSCGRSCRLWSEVRGRWLQEMFVGKDGTLISMTALNMHSDLFDHVDQFQFHQKEPGRVTLRLVRKASFSPEDEKKIRLQLNEKIGHSIELGFEFVPEIALTRIGKFKFIDQELPIRSTVGVQ